MAGEGRAADLIVDHCELVALSGLSLPAQGERAI